MPRDVGASTEGSVMQRLSRRAATLGALALAACAHRREDEAESRLAAVETSLGGEAGRVLVTP